MSIFTMQHSSLEHSPESSVPPSVLPFFQLPNVTRKLDDNLSVEIEHFQITPGGLSYVRFYDENGHVFIPPNLMCIDLSASTLVMPSNDTSNQLVFLLGDTSWYGFCTKETVLVYIHTSGSICLPTEVIPYPEVTDMSLLTDENHATFTISHGELQSAKWNTTAA